MNDHALDALLAEYAPPPVPAGLAERAAAAALALPQVPGPASGRRAGALRRHDRRGAWMRRPLLLGGVVLGLAVSGAVAATLAGVRLDRLPIVEAVLAKLPLPGGASPVEPAPPPRAAPSAVEPAPSQQVPSETPRVTMAPPPRAAPARDELPSVALPAEAPPRADIIVPRPIEPPPPPLPPPPMAREEVTLPGPGPESRPAMPRAGEEARLQQERIERAERLRAARQAQIERLQRIQQRRERIRRLRRD